MVENFKYEHDTSWARVEFEVDREKFTSEMALATLNFFLWNYDEEADPIEEVLKKYAIEALRIATMGDKSTDGVISEFESIEGFGKVDGSIGIKLTYVESIDIDESDLTRIT